MFLACCLFYVSSAVCVTLRLEVKLCEIREFLNLVLSFPYLFSFIIKFLFFNSYKTLNYLTI